MSRSVCVSIFFEIHVRLRWSTPVRAHPPSLVSSTCRIMLVHLLEKISSTRRGAQSSRHSLSGDPARIVVTSGCLCPVRVPSSASRPHGLDQMRTQRSKHDEESTDRLARAVLSAAQRRTFCTMTAGRSGVWRASPRSRGARFPSLPIFWILLAAHARRSISMGERQD